MIIHEHNVQICAGCMSGDLKLALSFLRDHNNSICVTPGTSGAERIIREIVELVEDAAAVIASVQRTSPEAGLGTSSRFSGDHHSGRTGLRLPDEG